MEQVDIGTEEFRGSRNFLSEDGALAILERVGFAFVVLDFRPAVVAGEGDCGGGEGAT